MDVHAHSDTPQPVLFTNTLAVSWCGCCSVQITESLWEGSACSEQWEVPSLAAPWRGADVLLVLQFHPL